jgi:hypothetical protein
VEDHASNVALGSHRLELAGQVAEVEGRPVYEALPERPAGRRQL